ncbi:MAG: sigma-54-dependent Fis family transcriptional regulator [Nitrospirae bacterium]|nr:sigma-54-dependent Fis family transcriptional regulator [Nitrospirota bacterium]
MDITTVILLIISDPVQNNNLKSVIEHSGIKIHSANQYDEGLKIIADVNPSLVILDAGVPGIHLKNAVSNIKEISRNIAVLLLTSITGVIEAVSADVDGVIKLPYNYTELEEIISRCIKKGNQELKAVSKSGNNEDDADMEIINKLILGDSKRILEVKNIIQRVAEPDITVLIRGESGTGKELAAQSVYRCSKRKSKPFVKVLCAAIPEGLLESELFGHEKGAFTGAYRGNPGKFEFANGGTIFLDEIGDVPHSLQVKLLQVLQDGEFSKIGGKEVKVDVRVIAATNKNLERSVVSGTFREDLFYRLNVVSITMPPLRERRDDIPVLSEFFLHKYCNLYNKVARTLSKEIMAKFIAYHWPGNVRELENVVKRIIVLDSEKIELISQIEVVEKKEARQDNIKEHNDDRPSSGLSKDNKVYSLKEVAQEAVQKAEEEAIRNALVACKWNKRRAAELLCISYKTLFHKMRQYNLLE